MNVTFCGHSQITKADNIANWLRNVKMCIRDSYQEAELPELGEGEAIDTSIPADPNVKNYSYTVVDLSLIHI